VKARAQSMTGGHVSAKLRKIADDIAESGNVALTRLTVLKRWLEQPQRLKAFSLWIAVKALSHKRTSWA